MKLSKSVEQACCILAIIAEHHEKPVTNLELAHRMKVSLSYLMKIDRRLVVAGIINSTQGVKGGFVLAKRMTKITLGEVVRAVEGSKPFFVSSGVIGRAFPKRGYVAGKGAELIYASFTRAEQKWFDELDLVTMEKIINNVEPYLKCSEKTPKN